jgi:hypothetical protein
MFQLPLTHIENAEHAWDLPGLNVSQATSYPDQGVLWSPPSPQVPSKQAIASFFQILAYLSFIIFPSHSVLGRQNSSKEPKNQSLN